MKPIDLQTGDYALVKPSMMLIKVSAVHHKKVGYHAVTHKLNWVRIDLLEPIPLTSEILEKLGFNKVLQQGCSNPYHWTLDVYEEESEELLYSIKAYKTLFRGMYISIDNHADCEPIKFSKQIEYFHELQNALRLCGLDELTDNIKMEG